MGVTSCLRGKRETERLRQQGPERGRDCAQARRRALAQLGHARCPARTDLSLPAERLVLGASAPRSPPRRPGLFSDRCYGGEKWTGQNSIAQGFSRRRGSERSSLRFLCSRKSRGRTTRMTRVGGGGSTSSP